MMKIKLTPSEFKNLKGIEYFKFEEDFIEKCTLHPYDRSF